MSLEPCDSTCFVQSSATKVARLLVQPRNELRLAAFQWPCVAIHCNGHANADVTDFTPFTHNATTSSYDGGESIELQTPAQTPTY